MTARAKKPRAKKLRAKKQRATKPARAKKSAVRDQERRLVHELEVHQAELESQNEELRSARRELESALARFTDLFDFAPVGYATIDARDVIHTINHAGTRVLGNQRARLLGVRFGSMIDRDDIAAFNALGSRVRTTGEPAACDLRLQDSEPQITIHVIATPQPHQPDGLLLAFDDVTERRAERERLAATERALREANQRKDEFLAMLSHELRNPLAPIATSLFVLSNTDASAEASNEARAIIERQIAHLTRIVDDLLDVMRISRGKIRLQRERIDLAGLVTRTADDHRAAFDSAGVALHVLPVHDPVWVEVDPARIVQAVANLIGNALKFTPEGGRVELALHRRDSRAELRVRDTGGGIPPDLLPHLFEPFTQAPQSLERSRGGLGLGLAMVKGLVELHGGTVAIASDGLGRGAEVVVTLPISPPAARAAEAQMPRMMSRRVLVIEDQPDSARILETALTLLGLDVRIANNGRAGVALAREFHPEVVLCDIGLPGMDGHEVARTFRRDRELCGAYLVALSGYAQPEDVERAAQAGFSRHLAKPASLETLVRVIADAP